MESEGRTLQAEETARAQVWRPERGVGLRDLRWVVSEKLQVRRMGGGGMLKRGANANPRPSNASLRSKDFIPGAGAFQSCVPQTLDPRTSLLQKRAEILYPHLETSFNMLVL